MPDDDFELFARLDDFEDEAITDDGQLKLVREANECFAVFKRKGSTPTTRAKDVATIEEPSTKWVDGLIVSAPAWFRREDFRRFLRGDDPSYMKPAAWSRDPEDEFADVFVTFDEGEGSDYLAIPEDIWQTICEIARSYSIHYGIIRISPFAGVSQ